MSGGNYDYKYRYIEELADEISETPTPNKGVASPELRKQFCEHLRLVADACKAIEWNDSDDGDSREESLILQCLGGTIETHNRILHMKKETE